MKNDFFLNGKGPISFTPYSIKKFNGVSLPGGISLSHAGEDGTIFLQLFRTPEYSVYYTIIEFVRKVKITFFELGEGIRIQTVLKSELNYRNDMERVSLKPGFYNISQNRSRATHISAAKKTQYRLFCANYSNEFLQKIGITEDMLCNNRQPSAVLSEMSEIIQEMFAASYEPALLNFFYENKIRELLFTILTQKREVYTGFNLTQYDIKVINAVDSIIAANIMEHSSISVIAEQVGLNEYKLKKGFKQIFGMGLFERLLFRRTELAKKLLVETDKPQKEIASLVGYTRITSFITAFRKRTGKTPGDFRKENRK